MKSLYLAIIMLVIFSVSIPHAHAIITPFFGDLTSDYVDEQLHLHPGWIAVMGTNASQDYVGPGQCSPYFNLYMRQGSLVYPHLNGLALNLIAPTKIGENQTMPLQLQVTNNENYALYNVTMLDWAANEFFEMKNLTKIDMLEPHQSKIISGNLTFATNNQITCFHYNGGTSKPALGYQISAENATGDIVESRYFASDVAIDLLSPLKQANSGIPTIDVECNPELQLMIRNEDGKPACVTQETVGKLVDRGWGELPLRGLPVRYAPTNDTAGPVQSNMTNGKPDNPLGVAALVTYSPYLSCVGPCPPYNFYLKINSNTTAYLLGYDICGNDFCVKNSTTSILLPKNNLQIPNYTEIGISENKKWSYGDTVNMRLEISPTINNKTSYFLDIRNSTIVP